MASFQKIFKILEKLKENFDDKNRRFFMNKLKILLIKNIEKISNKKNIRMEENYIGDNLPTFVTRNIKSKSIRNNQKNDFIENQILKKKLLATEQRA